jgi:site-specific recombinase XerD
VVHGTQAIRVLGKGDRERLVPLTPQLFRRLQRFAARVAPKERIFRSRRRSYRTGDYEPLTQSAVEHLLKDVAERAGITKRVYPHLLRHSFVTNYLRSGGNPILAAQIVGHTSLSMIQKTYQHLVIGDAAAELMRLLRMDGQSE